MHTTQISSQQSAAPSTARLDNFSCIVERYQSLVWAIAYASTGDRSQSDDITQETFLAAWKQQADIRDVTKMRSYLSGIARNLALRSHRQIHRHTRCIALESDLGATVETDAPNPLELMLEREQVTIVEQALRSIPSASREPFVLFYTKGKSIAGVAADLDLTEAVVKQRLYRARESLKTAVASQLMDEIVKGRPGKVLVAATLGLILGQSSSVLAAEAGAFVAGGDALAPGPLVSQPTSGKAVVAVASKALFAAAALALVLFAGALLYKVLPESDAATQQSAAVASQSTAARPTSQERAPGQMQHPSPAPNLVLDVPPARREGASDQPLVVGRILQNIAGADADQDGTLSAQEVEHVARTQEELAIQLVVENWDDPLMAVRCSAVGFDGHQTYESSHLYRLAELRADYLQDKEAGVDLSSKEWIASQLVTLSREGQICYEVHARYADSVQQLKAVAADGTIEWTASVAVEDGTIVHFAPPKELADDLLRVAAEDDLARVAEQWEIDLHASTGTAFHYAEGTPAAVPRLADLAPSIQKAIADAGWSVGTDNVLFRRLADTH